ncbi:hypothetical protein CAPTEDRAFT_153233 [Capitella teleta]|uniref:Arrestin C-terminal-like domain-containing protein n=1 Tax=Capitella teleta TaxID=283909 RepID=R7T762_CAPTE|nr:hypothetical protein CAPTEDRAFT_153233 [Capitella teleta]|eukprot:ELT87220.1 hypothetical protein CAPTEDRAFT_153233 [Capitella teleta]
MVEVVASLPDRSVYLAGETIECNVTFTNVSQKLTVKLGWASAQIHCQCSMSETRVIVPKNAQLTTSDIPGNRTTFVPSRGEKGSTALSTKPAILFCDLNLAPGESQTFTYRETIPREAPPSFRGTAIKYSYKVTVGAQRFNCPTKLLRVPFRVLVVPGLHDISVYQEPDDLKPNNPFQRLQRKENTLLEVAMEVLQAITCRKGPSFYNITNSKGKVARFCLLKQAFRIGDDIIGTCDFSCGTIPCAKFSVTLQTEEIITEECRRKNSQSSMVTSYSRHEEFCLQTQRTHISVPIPLTAAPGFLTDIMQLKWRLHFEFITCKAPLPEVDAPCSASESVSWQGPSQLDVETMVWDLPIRVFATNPMYATSVSLLKQDVMCLV